MASNTNGRGVNPNGFWPDMATEVATTMPTPLAAPSKSNSGDFGLPGTPMWWLRRLINMLLARQPLLDLREAYVDGNHTLPTGDRRWVQALQTMQRKSRTNYIGMVTSAPVERMRIRGFRFGPYGQADTDAKKIWMANDMDFQSSLIHQTAAKYGMAYALVSPPEFDSKYPTITAEDPRTCIVYRDPVRPTRAIAALRMWADDVTGRVLAILYTPDSIYGFVGPALPDIYGLSLQGLKDRLIGLSGGPAGFELTNQVPNPLNGMVGIVEYVWRPGTGIIPEGEAGEDVRDIQDRINHTMLDRLVITRAQAYKQRWVSGIKIPKSRKGQAKPPWDPGSDTLWVTANQDAKFGEFTEADITMILEAIRDDIVDIAAITKTPPHYLMGKMANVSGETLTQAESGFVSKTKQRMQTMGWSHEQVMRLCFHYLGDKQRATEVEAQVLWESPEVYDLTEAGDFISKASTSGVPLELIMDRLNFTPDEIEWGIKERDRREEVQNQQMQDQISAQAVAHAASFGGGSSGGGAKPAAKAAPKKPSKPAKPAAKKPQKPKMTSN